MELLIIVLFCAALLGCIAMGWSIIIALVIGLVLFLAYGKYKKHTWKELTEMATSGVLASGNILIAFVLIGMLTALWRASGTISSIICYTSGLIHPSILILLIFLLNSLVSFLTGTSFGTAATMGVICMSIASTMGISVFWAGGAVLSGAFFGDRCSPVSTSALLVSTVTETDLYENIRKMMWTALVPFILCCGIYLAAGAATAGSKYSGNVFEIFQGEFRIHPVNLIPAAIILILALFKVNIKITMSASIAAAFVTALLIQHETPLHLIRMMFMGYEAVSPELGAIMNGGGVISMVRVGVIVCIASSYSGLFKGTGLLNFMQRMIGVVSRKTTAFTAILLTAAAASALSCNQTLAIMLTSQLCRDLGLSKEELAIAIEDTAVVVAPLIPWSIAGTVPLAAAGAPDMCILGACFLYLVPAVQWAVSFFGGKMDDK
ncbi:MAG: Na+/H+ antiporter NhaC family protein [Coprococcus sp.]